MNTLDILKSLHGDMGAMLNEAGEGGDVPDMPAIGKEYIALRHAVFAELTTDKPYEDILADWAGVNKEQVGRVVAAIHAVVRGSGIDYAKFAVMAIEAWEGVQLQAKMKEQEG